MRKNLDKTYVPYVLKVTGFTAYKLAKETGLSHATFSKVLKCKQNLNWGSIIKIEEFTGVEFLGHKHIEFAVHYMEKYPELFNETSDVEPA